jgi:hypothetical protein
MAEQVQCHNCGAVLLAEDVFCGECGAPRAPSTEPAEPVEAEQPAPPVLPPAPTSAQPTSPTGTGWRVAFIVLVVLGAIACIAGILVFVLVGSLESEAMTPQEDWLYSALCCLLPIGGTGAILAASGGLIWYTRLRER